MKNLKEEYATRLLENGIEPYSVVRHSYTNNRMNGVLDQVQNTDRTLCPTLDTRCDCLGVVVMEDENRFSEIEKQLFTPEGNIRRYIGSKIIDEFNEGDMATTTFPNGYGHGPRTHKGESIALNTIDRPCVKHKLRIRKLVPVETTKLMGFERKDYEAMREINMSDSQIYHVCGDSLIVPLMAMLIGQLLPIEESELVTKVNNYVDSIAEDKI